MDVTEIADIVVRQMGLKDVSYRYTGGEEGRGWKGDVRVMLLSLEKIKGLGWRARRLSPGHPFGGRGSAERWIG